MKIRALSPLLLSIALCIASANSTNAQPAQGSEGAKSFVQTFYDWYAGTQQDMNKPMELEAVMKKKAADFSPELRKKLNDDIAASKCAEGEIVGLDFDPFLSTNAEPYKKYTATKVTQKGDAFLVEMHGVSKGKTLTKPAITPEVKQIKGKWQFANFHYGKSKFPENENLMSVLKELKKSRDQRYDD